MKVRSEVKVTYNFGEFYTVIKVVNQKLSLKLVFTKHNNTAVFSRKVSWSHPFDCQENKQLFYSFASDVLCGPLGRTLTDDKIGSMWQGLVLNAKEG